MNKKTINTPEQLLPDNWKYLSPVEKWKYLEDKRLSELPPGLTINTLNGPQIRQFTTDSETCYKAKTLQEAVSLWRRFYESWAFLWSGQAAGNAFCDDPASAYNVKHILMGLKHTARDCPYRLSDYPNNLMGLREYVTDCDNYFNSINAIAPENEIKNKMTDEIKRVSYNGHILTVLAERGRKLKFNVLDQDGAFRGPPLQPLKEHNQTHGCYTGVPIVKPQPGDRIVIVPADESVTWQGEPLLWQGEPVVTDGDAIDFVECQKPTVAEYKTPKSVFSGFHSVKEIAEHYGITNTGALRKRLERFRKENILKTNAFIESQNRGKNMNKYLYNVSMIEPIVQALSVKRPSKKKM